MKLTIKHYIFMFLLVLLAIVLIKNFVISDTSKPLPSTQGVIAPEQKSRRRTKMGIRKLAVESLSLLPTAKKERGTDRKKSGREDPFAPLIRFSPQISQPNNELDNREAAASNSPNKRRTQLVRLVGVIVDDIPIAILEVDDISYMVSVGGIIAEMEVTQILSDKIVLSSNGDKRIINLVEE